jgi:LysM repeat protein
MSITHEEARRLIQFRADDALKGVGTNLLDNHLSSCQDCQNYARSINELQSTLQPLMRRKWNQYPLPLSAGQTASNNSLAVTQPIFFATRIIAMGVICIAFLFNIWQFTQPGRQRSNPPQAEIPMIPTPSMHSTTIRVTNQTCETISYQVRENDTLKSIADQFAIPAEEIIRANQLRTRSLDTSMLLSIPVCTPTPSGTPKTIKTAFTPLLGSNTLTPVNGPTQ